MNITEIPNDYLSLILSLTSPRDVGRSSLVSKQFLSVSDSDAVWNKFLPSNIDKVVSQSSTPLLLQYFAPKKKLFLHLCSNPVLFNGETQSFALNKWNGKKCYMLGARALKIVSGDTDYWKWIYLPYSRFPETAKLQSIRWLLIEANINPTILSPNTTYGAYFVYKMGVDAFDGSLYTRVKVSMFEVPEGDESSGLPSPPGVPFKHFYLRPSINWSRPPTEDRPTVRDDIWLEIEMGRYYVTDGVNDSVMLRMTLTEAVILNWKSGLIVQGIELRPLD